MSSRNSLLESDITKRSCTKFDPRVQPIIHVVCKMANSKSNVAASNGEKAKATNGASPPSSASAWMDGADLIDSLLDPDYRVAQVLTPAESQGLANIKKLLVSAHIQHAIIPADLTSGDSQVHQWLGTQFGGVKKKTDFKKTAKSVMNSLRFIKTAQAQAALEAANARRVTNDHKGYLPPEWNNLSTSRKNSVYRLLKYDIMAKWDYNSIELSKACGEVPLLFMGWAILCAPHAQMNMAIALGLEEETKDGDNKKVYDFVEEYDVKPEVVCNFLRLVEADYSKDNPYHNSIHACDVTQTTFALLKMGGDKYASGKLEMFSLIVAAACHDQGHPGNNNSFQVNSHSDLAMIYNDSAVLENMHSARAYRLLSLSNKEKHADSELNADILQSLNAVDKNSFRANFTKAILWTDMSQHFQKFAMVKSKISTHGTESRAKFYINADGQSISSVLLFLLHVADISNPAKPAPIFLDWCDRCLEEFFLQGDAEKKAGMPVSPMCDRKLTVKSESQLGFIRFIVRPSFVLLSDLMPRVVDEVLPCLEDNLRYWDEQKLKEESGEKN